LCPLPGLWIERDKQHSFVRSAAHDTRLGRSLQDLVGFLEHLRETKVPLFLHQQGLDTKTPAGKAMFQMLGVFAEFERAIIRERVVAGMARAKARAPRAASRSVDRQSILRGVRPSALPTRLAELACARSRHNSALVSRPFAAASVDDVITARN
jgi:hypothetical protein